MKKFLFLLSLFGAVQPTSAMMTSLKVEETDLDQQLLSMVKSKASTEVVQALIEKGADVNATTEDGWTVLMWAVAKGYTEIVQALIEKGADVNVTIEYGWTALIIAAMEGHVGVCELLIDKGADVNATDEFGHTALLFAAEFGHTETALELIEKGSDVNAHAGLYDRTALLWAAESGNTEIVQALIEEGADVNAQSKYGKTVLMCAAESGHTEIVLALIEKGADVNAQSKDGKTVLMCAAKSGHTGTVLALIEKGADVNAHGELYDKTALMRAAENGYTGTVLELIKVGADVNATDKDGMTALMRAAENGHTETVLALIERGVDEKTCGSVFVSAVWNGHTGTVLALIENGADIHAQDEDGMTALFYAVWNGHAEIVRVLIENGADIHAQDEDGMTALMRAAKKGHTEIVQALIENGAKVNIIDNGGRTALVWAASTGHWTNLTSHIEVVKILVENDVDVNVADKEGRTALTWAVDKHSKEMIELLVIRGALGGVMQNLQSLDKGIARKAVEFVLAKREKLGLVQEHPLFQEAIRVGIFLEQSDDPCSPFKGAVVNAQSKYGKTVLMCAAENGYTGTVLELIKEGADVNAQSEYGETALMWATIKGHIETVQALIKKGADVKATSENGATALMLAALNGHTGTVLELIKEGADVNAQSKCGKTVLMCAAAESGHTEIVLALIEKGADVNVTDKEGMTALFWAVDKHSKEMIELLVIRGALGGVMQNLQSPDKAVARQAVKFVTENREKLGLVQEDPLYQEAIRVGILLEQSDDPRNPFKVYEQLQEKRKQAIDYEVLCPTQETISCCPIKLIPASFKKIQEAQVTYEQLPNYSKTFLQDMRNSLERRVKEEDLDGVIQKITGFKLQTLIAGSLEGVFLENLLMKTGEFNERVPSLAAKFIAIVSYLETLSKERDGLLSEQEEAFLAMLASIKHCQIGKADGVNKYYAHAVPENRKLLACSHDELPPVIVNALINSIESLCVCTTPFMRKLCCVGAKESYREGSGVHQETYIKNLLGDVMPLNNLIVFDTFTQNILYEPLLALSKQEVMKALFVYLRPSQVVSSVRCAINKALAQKDTPYMELCKVLDGTSNPKDCWSLTGNTVTITELGTIHLLEKLGILENKNSKMLKTFKNVVAPTEEQLKPVVVPKDKGEEFSEQNEQIGQQDLQESPIKHVMVEIKEKELGNSNVLGQKEFVEEDGGQVEELAVELLWSYYLTKAKENVALLTGVTGLSGYLLYRYFSGSGSTVKEGLKDTDYEGAVSSTLSLEDYKEKEE